MFINLGTLRSEPQPLKCNRFPPTLYHVTYCSSIPLLAIKCYEVGEIRLVTCLLVVAYKRMHNNLLSMIV